MKPPQLKRQGVVRRSDFAAYAAAVGEHLGFKIESPSIDFARDTGNGLHLHRRRAFMTVELEFQYRTATAFTCYVEIVDDVVYASKEVVTTYENGAITVTLTSEGGVHLHTPSDETYTCPTIDVVSDAEDGFDYGEVVSVGDPTYTDVLSPGSLLPAAAAALEDSGSPYVGVTRTWLSTTAAPTDITADTGYWEGGPPLVNRKINSYNYRWRISGLYGMHIEWEEGGDAYSADVAPNSESDWYEDTIPTSSAERSVIENVVIRLV